jgi:hypothetical protein
VTEDDDVTFRVMYADADADAAEEIKVVLQNGTETPFEVALTQEPTSNPWDVGRWFSLVTKLPPGSYRFRFNASDRFDFATGEIDWNPAPIEVRPRNKLPELQGGSFLPTEGDSNTIFRFEVLYRDMDDVAPVTVIIYINDLAHAMSTDSSGPWDAWVTYYIETTLPVGEDHRFYFVFADADDAIRLPLESDSPNWMQGPVVVRPNVPPILSSELVTPVQGDRATDFTFSIIYTDTDGDAPTTSLLYLDDEPIVLTADSDDYTNGSRFAYSTKLHLVTARFYFVFNDSRMEVRHPLIGTFEGPSVVNLVPTAVIGTPEDGERYAPEDFIAFNGLSSSDPDEDSIEYEWSSDLAGELSTDSSFDAQLIEGWHNITLVITDEYDDSHSMTIQLEVRPYLPDPVVQGIELDVSTGAIEGDPIRITVTVGNQGEAVLEGGLVSIMINGSQVYEDSVTIDVDGTATVQYTWTSTTGDHIVRAEIGLASWEVQVTVAENTPPTADPRVSSPENKTKYKVKETLSFTPDATDGDGDTLTFEWNFGDGSMKVTTEDAIHTFEKAGTYMVSLNVTDARGDTVTEYLEVVIKKPTKKSTPGIGAGVTLLALTLVLMPLVRNRRWNG